MRTFSFLRALLTGAILTTAIVASGCGSTASTGGGGTTDTGTSSDTGTGSDATTGDTGGDTATTDTGPGTDTTTGTGFATVYTKMSTTCATSGCHTTKDNTFAGNLDLSTQDLAYAGLTSGTPKDGLCGATPIVKKGDHAGSSLWMRLNADQSVTCAGLAADGTGKMPLGGTAYTAAELAAVAAWIDGGAAK